MNIFYLLSFVVVIYFIIKWKDNLLQKKKELENEKENKKKENFLASETNLLRVDEYITHRNSYNPDKTGFLYANEASNKQFKYAKLNIPFENKPPVEYRKLEPYNLVETSESLTSF